MTDEELIRRTLAGELTAFEALVARHREAVHRYASRMVGVHDADDVTQDALLRAFNTLDRFRGEAGFRTWLMRIAHNAAVTSLERRRTVPAAEPPEDPRAPGTKTPADRLEDGERRERLLRKLEHLAPAQRSVLVLRDVEGRSYAEIAELLELPDGTVRTRLHRARSRLADLLRHNTYDWDLPT